MKRIITILAVLQLLIISQNAFGQGWQVDVEKYQTRGASISPAMGITKDGGFLLASQYMQWFDSIQVVRLGLNGSMIWEEQFHIPGYSFVYDIDEMRNGDILVHGSATPPQSGTFQSPWLIRLDAFGNKIWERYYQDSVNFPWPTWESLITADDGILLYGEKADTVTNLTHPGYVIKLDSAGNEEWVKEYGSTNKDGISSVCSTYQDDGYLLLMYSSQTRVIRIDNQGNMIWDSTYAINLPGQSTIHSDFGVIRQDGNGGYVISAGAEVSGASDQDRIYLRNINDNGSQNWFKLIGPQVELREEFKFESNFAVDINGDYIGAFWHYWIDSISQRQRDGSILYRTDSSGNLKWLKYINPVLNPDPEKRWIWDLHILPTGFITYIDYMINFVPNKRTRLMVVDSLGNLYSSFFEGQVYQDLDSNCVFDNNDLPLQGMIVEMVPLSPFSNPLDPFIAFTDSNGLYSINLDTGLYYPTIHQFSDYWGIAGPCDTVFDNVTLSNVDTIISRDYPLFAKYECPYLTVNISSPFLRRCQHTPYWVSYCNRGTITADSAYIEVELDPLMQFNSASIPWDTLGGVYVFYLGDLKVGECGGFNIEVTYDPTCNETVLGQTARVSAHIYPDSICTPLDPTWDGSTMEVEALCENEDTVRLLARNSGPNPTNTPRTITIIEDNVMLARVDSIFLPNQEREWTYAANGKTYAIMAKQSEGHPLLSTPIAAVEGCGVDSLGNISLGFITPLPPGDEDPFIDIDCQPNVGAIDPNDKTPTPKGVGMEGYISQGQKLDYKIRFQNTGTDTAFNIWIRDTLPQELDITTLQLGASSHSYTFKIQPGRVLEWTFLNILLPDSFVNEPASNGFVQFSIQQADSLQPGRTIENSAAIFFDFNAPVITNTTLNTIVEDFATKLDTVNIGTGIIQNIEEREAITIYPNPNQGQFTIELQQPMSELTFIIYDAAGKQLMQEQFYHQQKLLINKPDYGSGLYLYELTGPDGLVARGKIIIQ